MNTFTVSTELTVMVCPPCGGTYALAQGFLDECQRLGGFRKMFACPYCHTTRGWGESEAERLKKEIAAKQAQADAIQRELTAAKCTLLSERSRADTAERKCRRITKRIHAGVCPCCNRTFSNLARHMQTKHPEQVPTTQLAK